MLSNAWLVIRNILAIVIFPGTVTIYIPYRILGQFTVPGIYDWPASHYLAFILLIVGIIILFRSIWSFAAVGRGTLAPFDETSVLVVQGLHRYVRNPMYIGVILILLAETWFFWSRNLLIYTGICFLIANAVVMIYEENRLRYKYAAEYLDYCKHVGRWIPGKPYNRDATGQDSAGQGVTGR